MSFRKCAVCGTRIENGSFCSEHSSQGITYVPFEVNACKCGKAHIHGTWKSTPNLTATLKRLVKEHVKESPVHIELPDVKPPNAGQTIELEASVQRTGSEYQVPVRVNGTLCGVCRQHGGYFEAIIQARNVTKERTQAIEKTIASGMPRIRITKKEPQVNGADYYVSNLRIAASIAERLHRRFGGSLTSTARLFSRDHQTMKDLYRTTYLLTFPDFSPGDVIAQKEKIILVQSLGKQCKGIDLKTGKRAIIEPKEAHEKLEVHTTEVVQISPNVRVLHPRTFQAELLQNTTDARIGQKINVVEQGGLYAVKSEE